MQHWATKLAASIIQERGEKEHYTFNSGMSISGPMHIGNLRGELILNSRVQQVLEEEHGKQVTLKGTYYTQDRFKGKQAQLNQFSDANKAEQYIGYRLIDVPDPEGCHDNWVEHFNSANAPYLRKFGVESDPITTTEFYKLPETKEVVRTFLSNKDKVREVLNQYRDRKYPEGWIPFDPLCTECNRIDQTRATSIDLEQGLVHYTCDCGAEGTSQLEKGKLAWRLEWSALWEVLGVDFEPYGKDHATPGGSRDSCVDICQNFGLNYPEGFAFNWVYYKAKNEEGGGKERKIMSSSQGRGITTQEYLDIGEPAALSYLYVSTKAMKEIEFDLAELPVLHRRFDRAERTYFDDLDEEERSKLSDKEEQNIKKNYELAVNSLPEEQPIRAPYDVCATIGQIIPLREEDNQQEVEKERLERLASLGHIPERVSEKDRVRVLSRIERATNWARSYAPEDMVYGLNETVTAAIKEELSEEQVEAMLELRQALKEEKDKDELKDLLFTVKDNSQLETRQFFQTAYLCLLGKKKGPRLNELIATIGQDRVRDILSCL